MNRSVANADGQQAAPAVELAVDFVLTNLPFCSDGHVEIDVAVAGMQVYISRQFAWDFEGTVTVAGLQSPACGQGRSARRAHLHVPIARFEFELIKAAMSGDVSVAGRGVQLAVDRFQVLGAVA